MAGKLYGNVGWQPVMFRVDRWRAGTEPNDNDSATSLIRQLGDKGNTLIRHLTFSAALAMMAGVLLLVSIAGVQAATPPVPLSPLQVSLGAAETCSGAILVMAQDNQ